MRLRTAYAAVMRYLIFFAAIPTLLFLACNRAAEDGETLRPASSPATARASATLAPTPGPEAETLAFIRDGDLWLINADGRAERPLSLSAVESFSWVSPEELDVVTRGDFRRHLLVDLKGNVRVLTFPAFYVVDGGLSSVYARGSWSPDGTRYVVPVDQRLVVFNRSGAEVAALEVRPPATSEVSTSCDERSFDLERGRVLFGPPVFSPDTTTVLVAVYCTEAGPDGGPSCCPLNTYAHLYQVSLEQASTRALPLLTNLRISSAEAGGLVRGAAPRFSPDGTRIAQLDLSHNSACSIPTALRVADADGANIRELGLISLQEILQEHPGAETLGGPVGYDWSPDGDAIAVSFDIVLCDPPMAQQQLLAGLYLLKLDGSPEQRLVDGPAGLPVWSPSGRFIAFLAGGDLASSREPHTIRVLDLTSHRTIDLAQGSAPAWAPQP
jgi:hypothetical protein